MITVPSWGMVVAALTPEGRIGRLYCATGRSMAPSGRMAMTWAYIPDPGFVGKDSVTFIVRDIRARINSKEATITIEVK